MSRWIRIAMIVFGCTMVLYPWISNFLYERDAGSQIEVYEKLTEDLEETDYKKMLKEAKQYNACLARSDVVLTDPFSQKLLNRPDGVKYKNLLNIDSSGMIAHIEIPCINLDLPIYKGTSNEILEKGIGHLEGTSIPVGGKSTHAVLTGHTGLNAAKLFTDLTELKKGDRFYIHVLNKNLAYEVSSIFVVLPEDTRRLKIMEGKDYVTLVTCTPYGVNSHRLLVRGKRVKYREDLHDESQKRVTGKEDWMSTYKKSIFAGICLAFILVFLLKTFYKKGTRK